MTSRNEVTRRRAQLTTDLSQRILCLDGATGTWLQSKDLGPDDFGGPEFEGCNEHLVLTRPDLILDLQGNGGGMLRTAIAMSDEFLSGDKLIVYTEGRAFEREDTFAQYKGLFEKGRLVVLIDEASASASEIVSGAVQDWDRGLVMGRRSFGKGLVQRPMRLPDGSAVRLTVQKYFTPAGRCIQKPYDDGVEAYRKEKFERYERGELLSLDSLELLDSLMHATRLQGRPVYGGGGILPDLFVPIDTTFNYHLNIIIVN